MKKQFMISIRVAIIVFLILSAPIFAINGDMGLTTEPLTDGSSEYPYLIEDFPDFQEFSNLSNSSKYWLSGVHIRLDCDLDLDPDNPALTDRKTYTSAVIAPDLDIAEDFQGFNYMGIFDGNTHTISNLTIDTGGEGNDYLGFFGLINGTSAEIKNLGIVDFSIIGGDTSDSVGGVCGENHYGYIINCYSTGLVTTGDVCERLGGLCGNNVSGEISECNSSATVNGGNDSRRFGGLCGSNDHGIISNCYATGMVTSGLNCYDNGGLCGFNYDGSISNCYSIGNVDGGDGSWLMGGLCGYAAHSSVINCYSTGNVTVDAVSYYIGGCCGGGWQASIINCYSIGKVNFGKDSTKIGGFSGRNYSSTFSNCFWDIETSGIDTSIGGIGKTTAEMKMVSTFLNAGWDLTTVWNIEENQTYPLLRKYSAVDTNYDNRVDLRDFVIFAAHWLEGVE